LQSGSRGRLIDCTQIGPVTQGTALLFPREQRHRPLPVYTVRADRQGKRGDSVMNNGLWRNGGSGNDTIDLRYQAPWDVKDNADGGAGNDIIYGNMADNQLLGDSGSDQIYGGTGNDLIQGGSGNDFVFGEDGNDYLTGGTGFDSLYGGADDDYLEAGADNDSLYGGDGDDWLTDGSFTTTNSGDDYMDAGAGNDLITSINGNDKIYAGSGNDTIAIHNLAGHNHFSDSQLEIHGGSGHDTLVFVTDGTVATFTGLGAHTDGIEAVKLDFDHAMTLNLSIGDVKNASTTDKLFISGDGSDTLNLTSVVNNGSHWEQSGSHSDFDANGTLTTFITFNHMSGGAVDASVDVESAIHVTFQNMFIML
jgi:RTX calcium-binding nonapeptide repeat (4 copies)